MQLQYGGTYQLSNVPFQAVESLDAFDYLGQGRTGRYDDGYGGQWNLPASPTAIFGTRNSRQYGKNRYQFWTEWQLLMQRDSARFLSDNDPLAVGVLGQLVNFTVGEEAQVSAAPKKKGKANKLASSNNDAAVAMVQGRIDAFKDRMQAECGYAQTFEEWCREYCATAIVDGEKIDRIYCTPEGAVTRRIEPEQVTQPPGGVDGDGWHLGVHCEQGDITKRKGYYVTWEPGVTHGGEYVDAKDICFYTRNTPVTVVRGVSDFLPIYDDLADIGRLIDGIRVGAKVKSKIAYIRSLKGATQGGLEDFVRKTGDNAPPSPAYTPGSGRDNKTRETLPPGAVVTAGDNVDFKTMPQGAIDEYINAANFCIRSVLAVRWNLAEFMANSDASNNNYASIMVSGGPPVRAFKANQGSIGARIKMIIRRVLEIDIALGFLPVGILEAVDIIVRLPTPVIADPLADAQVKQIEYQNNIRSGQSWQGSIGLDSDEENQQIMSERERLGVMAQPLPDVFGGNDGENNDTAQRGDKVPAAQQQESDSGTENG